MPEEEREDFAREVDAEHISARDLEEAVSYTHLDVYKRQMVQALKLFGKFGEEHDVHLMVQKTVHLQNAAVTHYTIAADPIFEELHPYHPHGLT